VDIDKYLFSNWATSSHGTPIISSRTWISFGHLLPILSPLTTISDLRQLKTSLSAKMNKKLS